MDSIIESTKINIIDAIKKGNSYRVEQEINKYSDKINKKKSKKWIMDIIDAKIQKQMLCSNNVMIIKKMLNIMNECDYNTDWKDIFHKIDEYTLKILIRVLTQATYAHTYSESYSSFFAIVPFKYFVLLKDFISHYITDIIGRTDFKKQIDKTDLNIIYSNIKQKEKITIDDILQIYNYSSHNDNCIILLNKIVDNITKKNDKNINKNIFILNNVILKYIETYKSYTIVHDEKIGYQYIYESNGSIEKILLILNMIDYTDIPENAKGIAGERVIDHCNILINSAYKRHFTKIIVSIVPFMKIFSIPFNLPFMTANSNIILCSIYSLKINNYMIDNLNKYIINLKNDKIGKITYDKLKTIEKNDCDKLYNLISDYLIRDVITIIYDYTGFIEHYEFTK
ncbi:MAG: hypothetical protein Edafosvirus11_8 [Edafosvirus sp.]|uniref:Uncharacterized protein n=1 Tax=Edafosvirus sp. TaxID=2487765 RepID=A0A3G4ZXQ1_9VIRU|nr:MAG: hypothetical protein Edafosvirus11_8 [Edafosvirus sp.]